MQTNLQTVQLLQQAGVLAAVGGAAGLPRMTHNSSQALMLAEQVSGRAIRSCVQLSDGCLPLHGIAVNAPWGHISSQALTLVEQVGRHTYGCHGATVPRCTASQ